MAPPSARAKPKVFISYVRENRSTVERLAGDLQNYSLDIRTDFSLPAGRPRKRRGS